MSDIALPSSRVPGPPLAERLLGDERLAKLAGRGDARAFGVLYARHHQAIYRYCRSILGNDHDAQDALQSTMMRAYAALARQERELAVKAWLFRIAHNEAVSILRRRRPEQELLAETAADGVDVEATIETRERLATLMGDLGSLPERQRGALLMRELSGLSIKEIAAALSISTGAAKQTLFEARSSLHELSEGRAMGCEAVRQAISERDGRILRARRLRAHLSACEDCRAFRAAIATRHADLRALAPALSIPAAGTILHRLLLGHGGGHVAHGVTSATGGAASSATTGGLSGGASLGGSWTGHAVASLVAKGLAGVAVLATATAGTVQLTAHSRRSSHPPAPGAHRTSIPAGGAHRSSAPAGQIVAEPDRGGAPVQEGKPGASRSVGEAARVDLRGHQTTSAPSGRAYGRQTASGSPGRSTADHGRSTAPAGHARTPTKARKSPLSRRQGSSHEPRHGKGSTNENASKAKGGAGGEPPARKAGAEAVGRQGSPQPSGVTGGEAQPVATVRPHPAR